MVVSSCDRLYAPKYIYPMPPLRAINLPEEYLKAIGLVIVRWNQLEIGLDISLMQLLGMDWRKDLSHVVFVHMAFPQRVNVFSAAVETLTKSDNTSERLKKSKAIASELQRLNDTRNSVVHNKWLALNNEVTQLNITARGKLKFASKQVDISELEKISSDISAVAEELRTFCAEKFPQVHPTRGAIGKYLSNER
jgi:hypothetical protein